KTKARFCAKPLLCREWPYFYWWAYRSEQFSSGRKLLTNGIDSVCLLGRRLMERKCCFLRVHQLSDPAAAGHLHRAVHDGGALLRRASDCGVKVGCLDIVKPHGRHWCAFGYSHHSAQLLSAKFEDAIRSHWPHIHILGYLPSKQLRVKVEGSGVVAGHQ